VLAVPGYFAAMGAEALWQRRRRAAGGGPTAGEYERRDTVASLTMGTLSLLAPLVVPRLVRPLAPGRGKYGKVLVGTALGAAAVTTAADAVVRRAARRAAAAAGPGAAPGPVPVPVPSTAPDEPLVAAARKVAAVGGVAAVAAGGLAVTTTWSHLTSAQRLWGRRLVPSLGRGPLALALAVVGWDCIYYWNHRFMHESRYMWALHEVHHSSERYNLSTALRQPVAEVLGTTLPYGVLCLAGISPDLVATARGVNLIYQFWVHTEAIDRLGQAEEVLNTPSHHRVHHGSNRQYLDRNHGGILIVWDRLFGTFEREDEPVVYGLTTNIDTFRPTRIASHEYVRMARDVAGATGWSERVGHVVRAPGWSDRRRERFGAPAALAPEHRPPSAA
jgi:sterol desaturase/sphingolipid hydroxylase (fatty acid hydroxylase superfamily)